MKVTRNTPGMLILERQPWLLGLGLIVFTLVFVGIGIHLLTIGETAGGLAFALGGGSLGVLAFWAFVRRSQLILDRDRDLVILRRRSMSGMTEASLPLSDVDRAMVQTSTSGDTDTHRPVLTFRPGTGHDILPITLIYVSGRGAGRAVQEINDWLAAGADGRRDSDMVSTT